MATTDKNIVITTNIGQTADPKIVFSAADATTAAQNITLTAYPTSSGTLSFEGSAGQLFSITNSLTGTIFSVNDVSGIPSIEVLDTGVIKLAQYSGNVLLGTATDNTVDKLQVNGSITGTRLTSTITTGTSPLVVASTTLVANLNADLLDGHDSAFYLDAANITGTMTTAVTVAAANRLISHDRRAIVLTPSQFGVGVDFSFIQNTTDSLADGGTYHGVMHFQPYADASGGGAYELGFTGNNNLWLRGSSNALTTWATWKKIIDDSHTFYLGTTQIAITRASGALTLAAVSVGGSAGSVISNLTMGTGLTGTATTYNGSTANTITIDTSVVTLTGTQALTNKTITSPTVDGTATSFTNTTEATNSTTAPAKFAGGVGIAKKLYVGSDLYVGGNITLGSTSTITGTVAASAYLGTTLVALNRTSGALSLAGVSVGGSAGSLVNALTIGTGLSGTSYDGSATKTIAIDTTVATLTGTQTLTNKTITSPTIDGAATSFTNTTEATNSTTAPVVFAGGVGIAKKLYVGGDLSIAGNFTVTGTTTTTNVTNLAIADNMIYLGKGNTVSNIDLGFAGNYYSGTPTATYKHTGLFRDASDGVWKFFQGYTPEPDAAVDIVTTDASFGLAPVSALTFDSTIGLGTAPFTVASTTPVTNLSIGGNAATATLATNISGGNVGTILYQSNTNSTSMLAVGSAGQAIVSAGTAAPTWATLTLENIPSSGIKKSVKAATTANIAPTTFTATTLVGAAVVFPAQDSITLVLNERILVKNQTTTYQNGIYYLSTLGVAGTTAWVLTRTADTDTAVELAGAMVNVESGTVNGGSLFKTSFKSTDTLATTAMYWNKIIDVSAGTNAPLQTTAVGLDIATPSDNITLVTGNLNDLAINSFGARSVLAVAASTYTRASTVYIAGAPIASTNATITTPYALYVAGGNTYLSSNVGIGVTPEANVGILQVGGKIDTQNVMADTNGSIGQYDAVAGSTTVWYNAGFRNDGSSVYFLSSAVQTTEALAKAASSNSYRPISWNLSTGVLTLSGNGQAITTSGQIQSSYTAGAPFTVSSSINVANLNASSLSGATFAAPGDIGSTTAGTGAFTTLSASSTVSGTGFNNYLASPPAIGGTTAAAGTFTTMTATAGINAGSTVYPKYEVLLDFGADVAGTWRKLVTTSLVNQFYSTIVFKIDVVDPQSNHGTQTSVSAKLETYFVACVRTEGGTVLDTPDLCVVRGPSDRIRAVKTSLGNYEIQIQNALQYREYLVTIQVYAVNGNHTVTYSAGTTAATGTVQYPASVGTSTQFVENLTSVGKVAITNNNSNGLTGLNITNLNTGNNTSKFTRLSFSGTETSLGILKDAGYISVKPNDADYVGSTMGFSTRTGDVIAEKMTIDGSGNVTAVGAIQSNAGFILNKSTITANYTIVAGVNAMSTGPITINNGVTVTVTPGQRWVVI